MKLKLYGLIIAISTLFYNSSYAQFYETVLDQGTEQNNQIPVFGYWTYSYSQSIYHASEFLSAVQGTPSLITKVSFFNVSGTVASTDNWTILIAETSKTDFQNNTDWIPGASMKTVFQGTVTANGPNNWVEVELDSAFLWDGVSNIVVGVRDQSNGYSWNQIDWGSYNVTGDRSLVTSGDFGIPDIQNPPMAQNQFTRVPKIKFEHVNLVDCENEVFTGPYNAVIDHNTICDNETFKGTFEDLFYVNGLDYQWQKLDNGTWVDLMNGDSLIYEGSLNETTDIRVQATCVASNTEVVSEVQTITVENAPTVNLNFQDVAYCDGNPAAIMASGANTYSWSPTNGLSNSNSAVVNASPLEVTTYEVKGSAANGCSSTETVRVSPIDKVITDYTYNATDLCSAPATINFEVSNLPALTGSSTWEYTFLDENDSTLAPWSSTNTYDINAPVDSVYSIKYMIRSTECPTIENESSTKKVIVGFGTEVDVEDYNCVNLGGSIKAFNDFGQDAGNTSMIYENDFSDPSNTAHLDLQGDVVMTGGRAVITPSATARSGTLIISPTNTTLGANNSMKVAFDLTADLPIDNWGTGGADGIAYSFADDINVNTNDIQNGRGSKLRLTFDSADNGPNTVGIYLVYGRDANTNVPNPNDQFTLAYNSDETIWKDKTDIPVELIIDNGHATLYVDGVLVFDAVALPTDYINADVTSWKHAFSASTGGDAMRHAIKNLTISTGSYEFGLTTSSANEPTQWQEGKMFDSLSPGTYYLWMRKDATSNCQKFVETIVIENTNPIVDLGGDHTICEGDSIVLDAGIPNANYMWAETNNTTQTQTVLTSGVYIVQVIDTIGCSGFGSSVVTVDESPNVSELEVEYHSSGVTIFTVENAQNGFDYAWDFGDGNTASNTSGNITHIYDAKGEYTVSVTVSNACGDTTITSIINITTTVGLSNENGQEALRIYPNPSNDIITIELANTTQVNVKIFDVSGKIVSDLGEINSTVKLDVSNWSKGVFFAHISNESKTEVVKLIVQ